MTDQTILVSDKSGKFTGEYIPKMVGHTGQGKHHLAITVLLYNSKGQVLLQKRKHQVFDDIWDFTGATHPLHGENGHDETFTEATERCLEVEYGIKTTIDLKNLGGFNYFAQYGELCENEHCMMMVGEYNGPLTLDPKVGYDYKWLDKKEFLKDIEENPKKYSPWAIEGVKLLKKNNFFSK
jgi:isopentenyl-diphosphate Delta-isomerase